MTPAANQPAVPGASQPVDVWTVEQCKAWLRENVPEPDFTASSDWTVEDWRNAVRVEAKALMELAEASPAVPAASPGRETQLRLVRASHPMPYADRVRTFDTPYSTRFEFWDATSVHGEYEVGSVSSPPPNSIGAVRESDGSWWWVIRAAAILKAAGQEGGPSADDVDPSTGMSPREAVRELERACDASGPRTYEELNNLGDARQCYFAMGFAHVRGYWTQSCPAARTLRNWHARKSAATPGNWKGQSDHV